MACSWKFTRFNGKGIVISTNSRPLSGKLKGELFPLMKKIGILQIYISGAFVRTFEILGMKIHWKIDLFMVSVMAFDVNPGTPKVKRQTRINIFTVFFKNLNTYWSNIVTKFECSTDLTILRHRSNSINGIRATDLKLPNIIAGITNGHNTY